MSVDRTAVTDEVARILDGHVHREDIGPLAARIAAAVLHKAAASTRAHAARSRPAEGTDYDHAFYDGMGQTATIWQRAAWDIEGRTDDQ